MEEVGYQREQDAMRIGGEEKADSVIAVEDEEEMKNRETYFVFELSDDGHETTNDKTGEEREGKVEVCDEKEAKIVWKKKGIKKISLSDQFVLSSNLSLRRRVDLSKDPRYGDKDFRISLIKWLQERLNSGFDSRIFETNVFHKKINLVLDIDSTIVHAISNYENSTSRIEIKKKILK